MEEMREQKVEALTVVGDYNVKLVKGIHTVVEELRGEKKGDTKEFLDQIITGINWVLEVTNRTMDIINEGKERINKEDVNTSMIELSEALKSTDDKKIAASLENGVIPFLEKLREAAKEVTA